MVYAYRQLTAWLRRWIRDGDAAVPGPRRKARPTGQGHAAGHRHLGPPPDVPEPRNATPDAPHDQPWVPTGGLVDRQRRSERRS